MFAQRILHIYTLETTPKIRNTQKYCLLWIFKLLFYVYDAILVLYF